MILRSTVLAIVAATALGSLPAWAQGTITENINNTGIPRNAPSLGLSNIYGLNPCSSGTSVGVTTPLFGIGGAVADIDKDCEVRNNAAVVITGLKDEVLAREILCSIKDIREAAIRVGKPCLQDQSAPKISAATPPPPSSASLPGPTVAAVAPVVAVVRPDAPAFCRTMSLDLSLYPDCTKQAAPPSTVGAGRPVKLTQKPAAVAHSGPAPVLPRTPVQQDVAQAPATLHSQQDRISRATDCRPDHRATTASNCENEPQPLVALQQSWIETIARRRIALAQAALLQQQAAIAPADHANAPEDHTAMLAYADKVFH